ncbi:Peptidyl-prolyl cis-trans isomerase CYP57 [Gracilariopsis chorda]|uniref:Peptidyl-prolyl cis-trans isomerase CYP57 n=1 Tax=Gracilariopsis chorda TaxID=448386 RepID=A0A2V3IDW1_9FLOR|nr:Peptidyl-prolyl cis-trans isomerase CYP57 [Gracilariopsis chorda]|eukprot:PXF40266.1 Peptidyl-prolyl cis-trans isomerase CYP57 [Gracilariopsis chorda]
MSTVYNLEPPTHGRVTLQTTHGPLDLRLWSAQTPQTCRNFIQHCLNGYYDGLPFHRIIPDLLVQTGDASGTGHGGQVAPPATAPLTREIVGRLKFRRRGLVAMVADDAGLSKSQFFITLAKANWLDSQHTIFAHVAGDTIFNVLSIANTGERDGVDDDAPRIHSVTIHLNPFPQLRPHVKQHTTKQDAPKRPANAGVRNRKLLSFGHDSDSDSDSDDDDGGDDEDDDDATTARAAKQQQPKRRPRPISDANTALLRPKPPAPPRDVHSTEKAASASATASASASASASVPVSNKSAPARPESHRAAVVREANEQFERLKAELHGMESKDAEEAQQPKPDDPKEDDTEAMCRAMAEVTTEDERDDRRSRKRRRKDDNETLRRLKAFEGKVVKARRMGDTASDGKMWYAKRLNLSAVSPDDEEYDILMPKGAPLKPRRG